MCEEQCEKDERMSRGTDDAFCFQDTIQFAVSLSSLHQKFPLDLRMFSQQSFSKFTLVVLTKSIFHESKQSFPFITSPLPATMTVSEALKE